MTSKIKQNMYQAIKLIEILVITIDMRVDIIVGNFRVSWWPMGYSSHSYKMENILITFLPEKVKGLTQDLICNVTDSEIQWTLSLKKQQQHTTSRASAFPCS